MKSDLDKEIEDENLRLLIEPIEKGLTWFACILIAYQIIIVILSIKI